MSAATAVEPEIKITAEPGPSGATFRFVVDRPVLPGAAAGFASRADAAGSPLAEAIFAADPKVSSLQVAESTLTVGKDGTDDWVPVAKKIGPAIRSVLRSGKPPVAESVLAKTSAADAEKKRKIEEVFVTQINPAVASHGGFVELVDVRNDVVYVKMSGGCQGCASSSMTLKMGIERAVREAIPSIVDVVDVTNHSAGDNPYFR